MAGGKAPWFSHNFSRAVYHNVLKRGPTFYGFAIALAFGLEIFSEGLFDGIWYMCNRKVTE
jgi:hypothetical protein